MIWKESYNLKQKNGIENYINIQNVPNKILKAWGKFLEEISQIFRMAELKMIFPALLETYAFSKCSKHERVSHLKGM